MIGKGAQYLTAAGFGRYRITAASLGSLDLLDSIGWLRWATTQAIMDAFGVDGPAVIAATNEYLNGIAASDKAKATALAGFINEDPMMVCSLGLEPTLTTLPSMPIRMLNNNGNYAITTINPANRYICAIIDFRYHTATSGTDTIIGSGVSDGSDNCRLLGAFNSQFRFKIGGDNFYGSSVDTKRHICESNMADGTYMDGVRIHTHAQVKTPASNTRVLYIFNDNGGGGSLCQSASLASARILDVDTEIAWYLPFMNGQTAELIDITASIASGTKTYVQRTGAFSITYGYMQNGSWVTWTPPTP